MDLQTVDTTLTWLFERFLEDPDGNWDISNSPAAQQLSSVAEVHSLGKHLVDKGLVKDGSCHEKGFNCTITTLGITRVSDGLSDIKYRILQASIDEKKKSMMEMLDAQPSHFRKIKEYASYLKRLGMIECIFFAHDVYAEPTYFGREWYEANRFRLVN